MGERSLFFNSAPGDPRKYQAQDFASYFSSVLQNGVIRENGQTGLKVTNTTGMNVSVDIGAAIIKGHLYQNTTPKPLVVGLPDATANRTDRIVLRLDLTNAVRDINAVVKRGTASGPPALQRDETIYEISLARIYLPMNTSSITAANITDERTDRAVAGTVRFSFEVIAEEVGLIDSSGNFPVKNVEAALKQLSDTDKTFQRFKMVQDSNGHALESTTSRPLGTGFYVYKGASTSWMPAGNGRHVITNKRYTFGSISTPYVHQTIEYESGGRYWAIYNDDTGVWNGWTRIADEHDILSTQNMINGIYSELTTRTIQNITALTGGATLSGSGNAAYREGKRVYVELICVLPSGMAAGTSIHTFSTALRPSKLTYMPIQANNNQLVQMAINTSGQLIVNTSITSNTSVTVYGSFAIQPER